MKVAGGKMGGGGVINFFDTYLGWQGWGGGGGKTPGETGGGGGSVKSW